MRLLRNHTAKPLLVALGAIVAAQSPGLLAQQQSTRLAIEEIIVTAQKMAKSLQDVPITISAFTSGSLEWSGVSDTDDLTVVVPGLQMGRQIGSSAPFLLGKIFGSRTSHAVPLSALPRR